jgi:hypothetical protein
VNEINRVKHYLKVNMTQIPEDRLRDLIETELRNNQGSAVYHSIRQVFRFLKWKLQNYPESIMEEDENIIHSGNLEGFFKISPASCKYTKAIVVKYTESLWKKSIRNELQQDGQCVIPDPQCKPIQLPPGLTREEEVMVMSMMYPNNTLNHFLHSINSDKFPSPMCGCGDSNQTAHHVLFNCEYIDESIRLEAYNLVQQVVGEADAAMESSLVLMRAGQNKAVMYILSEIVKRQATHLKTTIDL